MAIIDTGLNTRTGQFSATAGSADWFGRTLAAPAPSPGLPFADFRPSFLHISYGSNHSQDSIDYYSVITLNSKSNGIHPDLEGLQLNIGGAVASLPPGKLQQQSDGSFVYNAWVGGVLYNAYVKPTGVNSFIVHLLQYGAALPDIANPVQVRQKIGDDSGLASVAATIQGAPQQAMR